MLKSGNDQANPWDDLMGEVSSEYEQTHRTIREMNVMIDQSQAELNRMAQKNTTITAQLQQMNVTIDSHPSQEVRNAYDSALDTNNDY